MTTRNPDDELDREYRARQVISKLMQAVAGIDQMAAQLGGLGLRPGAHTEAREHLAAARRDTERVAAEFTKALRSKKPR